MKKPKRIRAVKAHIDQKGLVATTWEAVRDDTPYAPCYILRQSDIRALAEQMAVETGERVQSERKKAKLPPLADTVLKHESKNMTRAMLYLFNLHGITPGRARKGTK